MRQSLGLRASQQHKLIPELHAAIQLLPLSNLELEAKIDAELEANPLLELDENEGPGEEPADEPGSSEHEAADANENEEQLDQFDELEYRFEENALRRGELSVEEAVVDDRRDPGTEHDDWDDTTDYVPATDGGLDSELTDALVNDQVYVETLFDHLYKQMQLDNFSASERAIAMTIFDGLDSDGLLRLANDEIQAAVRHLGFEVKEAAIEDVLRQVQLYTPSGVAARTLRESLLVQLDDAAVRDAERELATEMVVECFDLIAERDYVGIGRVLDCDVDRVRCAMELIGALNPRPAAQFTLAETEYVRPDLVVRRVGSTWEVELSDVHVPRLRVSRYASEYLTSAASGAEKRFIREQLQKARLLVDGISYRNSTLLKTAKAIVEHQQGFFSEGATAMRPLVLADISQKIAVHESTISRLTSRKYMTTPRGVFELKYFFSNRIQTSRGVDVSGVAIRAMLKDLIAGENPTNPYSDNELARLLTSENIDVARRTVAKYREALAIPSSMLRKVSGGTS